MDKALMKTKQLLDLVTYLFIYICEMFAYKSLQMPDSTVFFEQQSKTVSVTRHCDIRERVKEEERRLIKCNLNKNLFFFKRHANARFKFFFFFIVLTQSSS